MKVVIFGLGAIGSNLFIQLVKQYPEWSFIGVDFDKVEDRNLRTQAYFREHVGLLKTMAVMSTGLRYVQKLRYHHTSTKITENTVIKNIKVLDHEADDEKNPVLWIDCFDNSYSRQLLKAFLPPKTHLLHLGFSPLYSAECIWDESYDVPNDVDSKQGDICSMVDAVGFIQHFIGAVMMNLNEWVVSGPTYDKKKSFIITNKYGLKWMN